MGQAWKDFDIVAMAALDEAVSPPKWFGSAKVVGEQEGEPFAAIYDFGVGFDTREEAEAYALKRGREKAAALWTLAHEPRGPHAVNAGQGTALQPHPGLRAPLKE